MSASTFDADTQDRKKTLDIRWTDKDGQFSNTWTYVQIRGREDREMREKRRREEVCGGTRISAKTAG
jgi:hypothetical protein